MIWLASKNFCARLRMSPSALSTEIATKELWKPGIDLDNELISTTAASGERRTTAIERLTRMDGQIFLQGIQGGVAFSIVIDELTGDLSLAIAADGETATGFGACTPD